MKQRMKWAALAGAAVLAVSLTACGSIDLNLGGQGDRMKSYVQGYLDLTYKGKFNQSYLEELDMTEAEAQEQYEQGLQVEVEFFENAIGIIEYPTQEVTQRLTQMYQDIYSHSDYTVGAANKLDSGNYAVEVTVRPIDVMTYLTADDFQAVFDQILSEKGISSQSQLEALTEDEYKEIDGLYAQQIMDLVEEQLANVGHGEAESFTVLIEDDGDLWTPSQEDFDAIDLAMIDYSSFGY